MKSPFRFCLFSLAVVLLSTACTETETNPAPEPVAEPEPIVDTEPVVEPVVESEDALVEGTNYHATGMVPCAMAEGQPMGTCDFGVRRQGDGTGIVTVTRPDGSTLWVVYENGEIISAGGDESFGEESDGDAFEVRRESDMSYLSVGDERYEIPDAVINGG